MLERFMAAPYESGRPAPLQYLLGALLQFAEQLTEFETVVLIKETLKVGTSSRVMIERWLMLGKLACTELVAGVLQEKGFVELAATVRASMPPAVTVTAPQEEEAPYSEEEDSVHEQEQEARHEEQEPEEEHDEAAATDFLGIKDLQKREVSGMDSPRLAVVAHAASARKANSLADSEAMKSFECRSVCNDEEEDSGVDVAKQPLQPTAAFPVSRYGLSDDSGSEEESEEAQRAHEYLLGSGRMPACDVGLDDLEL